MLLTETKRLLFYKYQKDDLTIYQQLMRNPKVAKYITGEAPTIEQSKNRFAHILSLNQEHKHYGFFKVIEKKTENPLGLAKLVRTDEKQAEIGYAVTPSFWRQGYGSEITKGLIEFATSQTPLTSLLAIVNPKNKTSVLLLNKYSFKFSHNVKDQKFELPSEAYVLAI